VREARGLAYAVYSASAAYADTGTLTLYAGTSPRNVDEVLALIDTELDRLRRDGVTPSELALAKGCFEGSTLLALEDSASRMARIAKAVTTTGTVLPVEDELARYLAVTVDDVERVLGRVLASPRSLAVVGPAGRPPSRGKVA
jgi:predicted Zn-dependent peptidase